jgi:hypothetical protein
MSYVTRPEIELPVYFRSACGKLASVEFFHGRESCTGVAPLRPFSPKPAANRQFHFRSCHFYGAGSHHQNRVFLTTYHYVTLCDMDFPIYRNSQTRMCSLVIPHCVCKRGYRKSLSALVTCHKASGFRLVRGRGRAGYVELISGAALLSQRQRGDAARRSSPVVRGGVGVALGPYWRVIAHGLICCTRSLGNGPQSLLNRVHK